MNCFFKKLFLFFVIIFTSVQAFSVENASCKTCEKPADSCACVKDTCCKPCDLACDCCDCNPKPSCLPPCDDAYNSPYRMGVCWDYFVSASFIYWEALEDGLEVGRSISGTLDENTTWLNFNSNYNPGFKAGFGMNFDWDNWDLYLEYTWLHQTKGMDYSDNQILPAFINSEAEGDKLSSQWKLDFDMLDFSIGRSFYVGRQLIFRPHFGGKALWVGQNFNQTLFLNDVNLIEGQNESSSWLVGPSSGLQTRWDIYCGFYLFGNVEWSLLYTQFDSILVTTNEENGGSISQDDKITITPQMDLALGLGWGDYCDSKSRFYLNCTLGYEFFALWDQNPWGNFYPSTGSNSMKNNVDNNLYFHGLTISARVDF